MIAGKVTLKQKVDNTLDLIKAIKGISGMEVLVGVPEETAGRKEGEVTNAQLVMYHTKGVRSEAMKQEMEEGNESVYSTALSVYITAHGSPLWKIPPRPIIEPALEAPDNQAKIQEDLKIAAKAMLDGKSVEAVKALHVAGIDGVNMIKAWFDDPQNHWPPTADSTVQVGINKKYKSSKKRKETMASYKAGAGGKALLVDTGQMKNAMSYVVDYKE